MADTVKKPPLPPSKSSSPPLAAANPCADAGVEATPPRADAKNAASPLAPAFDPECLLVPGPCPACAGLGRIANAKWQDWRRKCQEHPARVAEAQAQRRLVPPQPTPPLEQTDFLCQLCLGVGRQLSALGHQLVAFLRPYLGGGTAAPTSPVLPAPLPGGTPPDGSGLDKIYPTLQPA